MNTFETTGDWTWVGNDYQVAYAETNDPRVLAVIALDDEVSFKRCLDGDAINPTYLIDREHVQHAGGFEDDEDLAKRIIEAERRFVYAAGYRYDGLTAHMIIKANEMAKRWAWIFHGTTFLHGRYGYQGDYDVLALNTPAFREHVGAGELTREQAQEDVDAMSKEIAAIADGEVFGIGFAVNEGRVLEQGEIDFAQWTVDMQSWGFVGEEYAKREAGQFSDGAPDLPEMINLDRFVEHTDHLAGFDIDRGL